MQDQGMLDTRPGRAAGAADAGIVRCDGAAGLVRIGDPSVRLVIWRRTPTPALAAALAAMETEALPEACLRVAPAAASATLRRLFAASAGRAPLQPLADDVAELAAHFAAALGIARVQIRLERLANDACSLFHVDNVPARLITTYLGPTTEYLPEFATDRAGLGQGRNDFVCRDVRAVRRLPPGAVGLFKGSRNAAGPAGAAVHRSPPIEAAGVVRYLLVIDDAGAIARHAISCA
jgi:hypothetical protein